jgi:hypothetical protein
MENDLRKIPDTPIIREATTIVKAAVSQNIFHHSMRTYHLGAEYAEKIKVNYASEELLLSALFHDIGLFSPYQVNGKPFQIASSLALKDFLLNEKKIPPQRINAMMEAIDFHFQFLPRWDKGEVAGLLQIGAHMDVIGKNSQMIDLNKRREILTQYPKNFFFLEFNICLLKSISSFSSLIGLFFTETYFSHNHYNT